MQRGRLSAHPSQTVSPSQKVNFTFEGKTIEACQGDTVASALYASGVRVFTRSFKYHRPRGLLCLSGNCPNCLMNVDGVPSVRTCAEPVQPGMEVRHQNAWPTLRHDLLSVLDKLHRLMPVGFYYKTFIRPRFLWRLAAPLIRRVAGLGKIDVHAQPERDYQHYYQHTDVAVVGGGPAGAAAALEAASQGVRVTLIDDQPSAGGHLRADTQRYENVRDHSGQHGYQIARELGEAFRSQPNIQVFYSATALGCYEGNLLGVLQGRRLVKIRSKAIVVATGSYEEPLVFQNNDLPGVFLGSGIQRLVNLYGIKPGRRAVVVTTTNSGYAVAADLIRAQVQVVGVVDSRPSREESIPEMAELDEASVPVFQEHTVARAGTAGRVTSVTIVGSRAGVTGPKTRRLRCDLICVSGKPRPATALLQQAGCKLVHDNALGETVPQDMVAGMYAAGDVTGIHNLQVSLLQGRIAGLQAAAFSGVTVDGSLLGQWESQRDALEREYRAKRCDSASRETPLSGKQSFVCLCEDVTQKDLTDAVAEGYGDIEMLKRYSTFSMGPCQGKMCQATVRTICARETGRSVEEVGATTFRPPVRPLPLGALAGPSHMPVRLTPMHRLHLAAGAHMTDVGQWSRPEHYGSVEEEYRAVRERVGIIDVSTLGKLDIQGADAAWLLDRVYTNTHSNTRAGRTRYGIVCADNGVIMDDGTVSRVADDRFYVTTGTGNTELMEEWFKWWAAGSGKCVHVSNVTAAYAAINVAGPQARALLSQLTGTDLGTGAFGYMTHSKAMVAGVPTRMIRVGFVGETGWELHFPSEYGEYLWSTLMETGQALGIAPFGVQAQRVLRLEKKHIIPGQDTDASSNPLEADMAWVARFDKEDFIGRAGLLAVQQRGLRDTLVGFEMEDGVVPRDGDPVVANGLPIGRVTSSRFSYVLGKGVGMAWVPTAVADKESEIEIMVAGKKRTGRLAKLPFYDPDGNRLRE